MKHLMVCLLVMVGCGQSGEDQAREDLAKEAAKHPAEPPPPPPAPKAAPAAPEAKPAEPPAPEPTTPADIEHAFKQAMIDQKDKDVLKYCDMMKLDAKSNIQSLMGCTLSGCRTKDAATAQRYAGLIPQTKDGKALKDQAKKICAINQIAL